MPSETNAAWPEAVKSPSAAGLAFLRHDLATRAVAIAMIAALSVIQLGGLTATFRSIPGPTGIHILPTATPSILRAAC